MASTYRLTMTDAAGVETVTTVTQDELDELTDQHYTRDSAYPVGVAERQRKDGTWAPAGGWDARPRETITTAAPARHDYVADMEATARVNDAADRRENRRAYYLRTGR